MCLAVPAKVIERQGDDAVADLGGNRVRISLAVVPEAGVGDWVLLHAGFAIQKLGEEQLMLIGDALRSVADAGPDDATQ